MLKSKLLQVLTTFSTKELDHFVDFVQSPFFNKNNNVVLLLRNLKKGLAKGENSALEKRKIFLETYPDKAYNENYLRKQTSILFQLLQQFMGQLEWSKTNLNSDFFQLQQLKKRNLNHLFQLQYQSVTKQLQNREKKDSNYFFQKYQLSEEADKFFIQQQKRHYDSSLQEKMDSLDIFYLIEKLKGSCEILNRRKILEGNYQLNLTNEILTFLNQENKFSEVPIIKVYLQIFKTLQEEANETHYENLVFLLGKFQNAFPQKETIDIYRYAQNYCIRRINGGQPSYYRKLFELFQNQLKHEINLRNGILAAEDYKNIVTVGLKVKEATWVKNFIFQYKENLLPEIRENVFSYNLASFYYGTQNYDAAIQLLSTVRYTDIYYEISGKIILAKTYFIKKEFEVLIYFIDAFKLNLQRNKKIAFQYRQRITNFLIQFKKVVKFKMNKDFLPSKIMEAKREKLSNRIQEVEPIIDAKWLLMQIE